MTTYNQYTPFAARPIAITDIETTGLSAKTHEIIEIGMVLVDQNTLEIIDTLEIKIKPEFPERGSARAFEVNGYNPEEWLEAVTLPEAMKLYAEKTKGAVFCAHNVTFDWSFVCEAFEKAGIECLLDYHRLDTLTMAWSKLGSKGLTRMRLSSVCEFLGLEPEPEPHRAMNGAMSAYRVYKALMMMDRVEQEAI